MLPQFYQACLGYYLSKSQILTLEILIWLLQVHKQVKIERLAACFPLPILYESRRRHIQRFLTLPSLSIPLIWFPLIKYILRTKFSPESRVIVALDRTQWQTKNLLMVSVIWHKRALPIYWQFLEKRGSSNLAEQLAVLRPLTNLNSLEEAVKVYKARSGIEALFKDCKTGGYNLEGSQASIARLTRASFVNSDRLYLGRLERSLYSSSRTTTICQSFARGGKKGETTQ